MTDAQTRALARRLRTLEKARLGAKQPTLGFSTIDDGAITATDVDGNLTMIIGKQFDETSAPTVVTGPPPPAPQAPFLTAQVGALRIYWDGTFEAGALAPMDFSRVLAYAVPLAEFTTVDPLNQAAIVGEINTATGGEITAALNPGVEYVVWLAAWSMAGKFSNASSAATATTGTSVVSYTVEYSVNTSETVPPTTGWSSATPVRTPGSFVWVRTTTHSSDGADVVGAPALMTGNTGAEGAQGVPGSPGTPGTDGASLFTWVKYATTPTTGMSDDPTGKTWIGLAYNKSTATESTNYADYTWSLIKGADGQDGSDGNPGPPGADGSSLYTWVKYATSAVGAGMSDDPTGKTYIGFAYNKTTATESTTASDYSWSLIQGPQGIQGVPGSQGVPGPPGADGTTTYTWLKYADSPTTGMSDSPAGKTYMGLATNKTSATESTNYGDYTWSLIQGPQGNQGVPGTPGSPGASLYTWVKYADSATGTGMSDSPVGKAFIGLAYNKASATESTTASDYTWSRIVGEASDLAVPPAPTNLEVIDGIGAFYLRWVPPTNPDKMRFEVHVYEGATAPAAPTPGGATKVAETDGYSQTLRSLPGTNPATGQPNKFKYTTEPSAEDPTQGDHPYWFSVIAKDIDGPGPATPWVSGRLYQITGPDIRANTVKAENIYGGTLTGDLFSGTVLLGSTISTGAIDDTGVIVGARSELGPNGIFTYDAANKPIVKFPTDGSGNAFVRADFEMLSAKVLDNFSMFGLNNSIGKDGRLMLAAGVQAPSAPPTISYEYDQVQLDTTLACSPQNTAFGNLGKFALDPSQINSIAFNTAWNVYEVVQQKSGGFRIWHFDTNGQVSIDLGTGERWVDDYDDRTNCTNAFGSGSGATAGGAVLFQMGGVWYFWGPTGINVIPNSWILDVDSRPPVLGYDASGDKWFIAQSNGGDNGTFHVRRFTVNRYSGTGAFPNATSSSTFAGEAASGLGKRPNGVYFGPGDFGSNRYVWNVEDYLTVYVFDTGGVLRDDEGAYELWSKPEAGSGLCWNGSAFVTVGSTGVLTQYTSWNWPTLSSQAWVGASAYDSDTGGDPANPFVGQTAGQHETPVGALASISQRRRARLVITMPETPDAGGNDDVDKWKLYYARQTSMPTKTNLKYIDMIGSPTARTSKVITADPTGGNPPGGIFGQVGSVNNFPSSNPAKLISVGLNPSGNPTIELNGDGAGRVGPFAWDKNGNDTNDTGWIAMSLAAGVTNYGGQYATAAYRRIGKQVFLRGLVNLSAYGPANPITTLPVGFRPAGGVAGNDLIMNGSVYNRTIAMADTGNPSPNTSGNASAGTNHTHSLGQHNHTVPNPSPVNMVSRVDVMSDGRVHCASDGGAWCSLSDISFFID